MGSRPPPPFRLVLAPDSATLARIANGRAPSWGAGIALPGAQLIVLRGDLGDVRQTLHHEIAHLVLHDAVRGRVPLWFDEGYASFASGEAERILALRLNLAVASGQLPSLDELDRLLRGSARTADAAYGLAASAVETLDRRNPPGALERLFDHMGAGEGFDESVLASTGLTADRFETAWHQDLRRRYGVLTWLLAGGVWTVLAFMLGGLLWYRRRADRPRREALNQDWTVPEEDGASTVDPGALGH